MCCGGAAIGPAAGVYHEQDSGYYRNYAPNEHGAVRLHPWPSFMENTPLSSDATSMAREAER